MKSYHHILVPIDGSDYAKQALQQADRSVMMYAAKMKYYEKI